MEVFKFQYRYNSGWQLYAMQRPLRFSCLIGHIYLCMCFMIDWFQIRTSVSRAITLHQQPLDYCPLMFCWPCIIMCQYDETNLMHLSFSLLRIKDHYMFRALLAHPQKALHKRHLLYCVRVMSVGCTWMDWNSSPVAANIHNTHARNKSSAVCVADPEDEQVMLETCSGPWFWRNWMKSSSGWLHRTDYCPLNIKRHRMFWVLLRPVFMFHRLLNEPIKLYVYKRYADRSH
jgi:hypothetical protein